MLTKEQFNQLKIGDCLEDVNTLLLIENIETTMGGDTYVVCKSLYPGPLHHSDKIYLHQQTVERFPYIKLLTKERLEYYNKLMVFE